MTTQILLRRGTESQWLSSTTVLAAGEPSFTTDTQKFKIGNGSSLWSALPITNSLGVTGGSGISVTQSGSTFTVSSSASSIGVAGGTGINVALVGSTFTVSSSASSIRVTGGTGISVTQSGSTFTVSSSASSIGVTGGTGISVTQSGSTFTVSSSASSIGVTGGTGISVTQSGSTFTVSSSLSIGVTGGTGISVTRSGSTFTVSSSLSTGISLVISPIRLKPNADSGGQPYTNPSITNYDFTSYPDGIYTAVIAKYSDTLTLIVQKTTGLTGPVITNIGRPLKVDSGDCSINLTASGVSVEVRGNEWNGTGGYVGFYVTRLA